MIYFIQSADGPIKIGYARDPRKRLAAFQTCHHLRLKLVGVGHGGFDRERVLHRKLAAHKLHGEWFTDHPDVLAEVANAMPPEHIDNIMSSPDEQKYAAAVRIRAVLPGMRTAQAKARIRKMTKTVRKKKARKPTIAMKILGLEYRDD